MNLSNEFNPIPKPQTEKRKPKVKPKKPKKKKRNPLKQEIYKGRTIPTKQQRGKISAKEYNKAIEAHGYECWICCTTENLEAHHVKFRASGGRGTWRNIRFLCSEHHRGNLSPHQDEAVRKKLEEIHEALYGPYYYCDVYDLYKLGLVSNTTQDEFERFMKKEQNTPN